ncbi:hypothetical protein OB905_00790 [Halobacteria archaeon AArc-dxtr1]|nr:hypothetical protein [Halobacteria archaeon AArc-dxtr1]
MNRRELLTASSTGVLLGVSGCLDELESQPENGEQKDDLEIQDDVEGCTAKEAWGTEATSGPEDPDPGSIADRFDCASASRPEPTGDVCKRFVVSDGGEYESHGIEPYPDPPAEFTDATLTTFVHDYEQARFANGQVTASKEQFVGGGLSVDEDDTRILDLYPDITSIRIQYSTTVTRFEYDSHNLSEGHGPGAAVYGIDETGVVRTSTDPVHSDELDDLDPEDVPDPVDEGTLLECL